MTDHETPPEPSSESRRPPRGRRFKTSHIVLAVLATLAGTWLVGVALHAHERSGIHASRYGGWHHGGDHGGMMERLCSERRGGWLDDRIELVESFVAFTPEQEPAWQGLTTAVRNGSERVGEACAALAATGDDEPPGRLARVEVMLEAGLDLVRAVRPAFEDFYAVLDDGQKAALDRLIERRGHD